MTRNDCFLSPERTTIDHKLDYRNAPQADLRGTALKHPQSTLTDVLWRNGSRPLLPQNGDLHGGVYGARMGGFVSLGVALSAVL